jgi:hypothetical protein
MVLVPHLLDIHLPGEDAMSNRIKEIMDNKTACI